MVLIRVAPQMAHRDRERIGGVVGERDALIEAERAAHHVLDLRLVGVAECRRP